MLTQNSTKNPIRKLNFKEEEIEIQIKLYITLLFVILAKVKLDVALEFRSTFLCESSLYLLLSFL